MQAAQKYIYEKINKQLLTKAKNKYIITTLVLSTASLTFAMGDLVRDVASVPGNVVQATGEVVSNVGEAITPGNKPTVTVTETDETMIAEPMKTEKVMAGEEAVAEICPTPEETTQTTEATEAVDATKATETTETTEETTEVMEVEE